LVVIGPIAVDIVNAYRSDTQLVVNEAIGEHDENAAPFVIIAPSPIAGLELVRIAFDRERPAVEQGLDLGDRDTLGAFVAVALVPVEYSPSHEKVRTLVHPSWLARKAGDGRGS
jgi:hypothetical protein